MRKLILLLIFLQGLFLANSCWANSSPMLATAQQQFSAEQVRHVLLVKRLEAIRAKAAQDKKLIAAADIQQANLAVILAKSDLESIDLSLTAAEEADRLTENNIESLEASLQNIGMSSFQAELKEQLASQQTLHQLQRERIQLLTHSQETAEQTLEVAREWSARLQHSYGLQQQLARQQALNLLADRLKKQQDEWLTRLNDLNRQLERVQPNTETQDYLRLESGIFEAEEKTNLLQLQIELANLKNNLNDLVFILDQSHSVTELNNAQQKISDFLTQLKLIESMLHDRIKLLEKRSDIMQHSLSSNLVPLHIGQVSLDMLSSLLAQYKLQLDTVNYLKTQIDGYQTVVLEKLNRQLASRQGLPGFDLNAWQSLGEKLQQIPLMIIQVFQNLSISVIQKFIALPIWRWMLCIAMGIAWLYIWVQASYYIGLLRDKLSYKGNQFLSNQVLTIVLNLISLHLPVLMLIIFFTGLPLLIGMPIQSFFIPISLALIALVFKLLISLGRFLLLEHAQGRRDIRLFRQLSWVLIVGGFISAFTLIVLQLPLAFDLKDLVGRIFMSFLLIVAIVLMRSWLKLPALLGPYLEGKRVYLKQAVRWLSLLIPISLFFNALIGLVGYVELAWSMAIYQGLFLLVLTGYILCVGVISELIHSLADRLIRQTRNGWLWREALLKPLQWVLRVILFIIATFILCQLYGWGASSLAGIYFRQFLNAKLFSIAGTPIHLQNIIDLLIIIVVFVWATRWTREFAYRWIFRRVKDLGLRNSLAIFSQYVVVTTGIIIGLHITGISITALTVILSAFAFGISFGLRDLANNLMSGILLLIERPMRVGDYVNIGSYEGEVRHIGMRSVIVTTDDHQDLMVPNANIFSQPFINLTHHDSIVRSLIFIKANRVDDPHKIKYLIEEVLKGIPKILSNPPLEIYFKEIDDVLLKFQIGYYVDLRMIYSRSQVRSQVLYALWDRFKQEGIHPPDVIHEVKLIKEEEASVL